ncbi:DUF305 domain-containing protein [Embleya sp. NPDC005575]|uniref:DUF305 domain-containing protein n=1 Tax=Embleya sp. NPDC005575 TaxID=3156892 RepID=UPI0033A21F73
MKRLSRALALTTAAATGALILAACGSDDKGHDMDTMDKPSASAPANPPAAPGTPAPTSAGVFNDADAMFAQMMIPHHEQAVEMAKEAPAKAANPEVKKLAAAIEQAQAPEIAQMKGWLAGWGKPTAAPGGMSHGDGMMSDADMTRFKASTGAEFDRQFLTMMIAHHNGAITMAETELAKGTNPDARKLAEQIKTSQAAEVQHMRQLLGAKPGSTPSMPSMPGMDH